MDEQRVSQSEPDWWYAQEPRLAGLLLAPASWIYGAAAVARMRLTKPFRAKRAVICVGNFTAGGAGKTPLTLAVAEIVRSLGREPWALSRGYGGNAKGPLRINPAMHAASEVGDEPLLLARSIPTVVARSRSAGAEFIDNAAPASAVIVMDDGLQNPTLAKDLTLAVVDRTRGIGNGRVIPAGPLRAPLSVQIALANAIVINGPRDHLASPAVANLADSVSIPTLACWPAPDSDAEVWRNKAVLAYAGIANPGRFFALLRSLGARVMEERAFPDHHAFTDADAASLMAAARRLGVELVTTEKDFARIAHASGPLAELRAASKVLAIKLEFSEGDRALLTELIARAIGVS